MSRDYKTRATRKRKKSLPGYIWLLSGLAIGLFIAFIVYLDIQPDSEKDFGSAVQEELEKLKIKSKKQDTTKAETDKITEAIFLARKFCEYVNADKLEKTLTRMLFNRLAGACCFLKCS